jgi:hypothetical protein
MPQANQLTRTTLFDLLRRDGKNTEHFNHDFHDNIGHRLSWSYFSVTLETFEELFDTLEQIDEHILTCTNVLSRLMTCVTMAPHKEMEDGADQEENTHTGEDHFCG